jgi:hypothetical protein
MKNRWKYNQKNPLEPNDLQPYTRKRVYFQTKRVFLAATQSNSKVSSSGTG